MEKIKQLGVSKIDDRNRTYIPEKVVELLKIDGGNNWLSWEQNEKGQIFVLKGHLRFLRQTGKMGDPPEGGEEKQTPKGGNINERKMEKMDKTRRNIHEKQLPQPPHNNRRNQDKSQRQNSTKHIRQSERNGMLPPPQTTANINR